MTRPVDDSAGPQAASAHLKGFAFEYMTNGEAVVLGDPGPWLCAGMTGGTVFQRLWPELGLDEAALQLRLAQGAAVSIRPVGPREAARVVSLLGAYVSALAASGQSHEAAAVAALARDVAATFVAIRPANLQVDQAISTE